MTHRNYLESIIIPSNGQNIAFKMKEAKKIEDADFYQALWWYDIFHYEDQNTLNNFIDNFSPSVENDSLKYNSISNITENDLQTSIDPNVDTNEQTVINSFEQIDDFISQLDLVLKKSRHDVFNLMLDPNGINSPDDFQSAVESLELALSSLRAIKKQIIEMKRDV